ncbi:MAG: bacillithiol biosynthesis cysteine-adding enzyme BshC [Melioribacteraceae bacterium]|nr:bacillithiol biosynthesis cysteine-adding enzyme BshC [Melioribacteraceae bacterium]MCF8354643.1 bacillithiol biosynthesis cysteine-adding enzyme BshC [Melioribacteraceae bacterium]MCF8394182.1 bacillithiol biosynthesis cysteine-adding enzyme BshC [Melioribacteraceae bacterium]MCF8418865.1 bacillithiol biosynthesis cysteine-adding enzyme BshC [Melioribacteraceae bacterium]
MYINFSDLPSQQNLFLDYMYEFENVERFYGTNFRDTEQYGKVFESVKNTNRDHREKLKEIIYDQYRDFKPSKLTLSNIDAMKSKNTIAVVTGQQLGLLGGPLYTFYKIITAIKLAAFLKDKYHDYQFVPVFWLEGDDHDFDEVRSFNLMNKENDLIKIQYDDGKPEDENRGNIGSVAFNDNINEVIKKINDEQRVTEFTSDTMNLLEKCYYDNTTFKEAFKKLLFNFYDEYGLILFDPQHVEIKKLLKPIFKQEIENFRTNTNKVVEQSAELEEIYHAQVKVKPINLFLSDKSGRFLLEPDEEEFRLRNRRVKFTKEDILQKLEDAPEDFSPNVLLRPICQDFLLPTALYVAGPSEISYFAQITPLYDIYNLPKPIIYPRSSITIVEKNLIKILEKYDLNHEDFFIEEKLLNNKVIESLSEFNIDEMFGEHSTEIELQIDRLKEKLFMIDPNLSGSVKKTYEKIVQSLDTLKSKAKSSQERNHDTALRQLDKARNSIFPNNNLQEREFNFIYFTNKYGMDIIKWLFNELTINKYEHQILEL